MWKWSEKHYDDSLRPGPTHEFFAWLESQQKLLRVYTTNCDGLELDAGVGTELVVQVHGTMGRGYCIECDKRISQKEEIAKSLKRYKVPLCHHFDSSGKFIDGPEPKGRQCTGESSCPGYRFHS